VTFERLIVFLVLALFVGLVWLLFLRRHPSRRNWAPVALLLVVGSGLCLSLLVGGWWFVASVSSLQRGPAPPQPTANLYPSIVGEIVRTHADGSVELQDGTTFPPTRGAQTARIFNWPQEAPGEPIGDESGFLLLAGQRSDGSWWYQIAWGGGEGDGRCWAVGGGSFDLGDKVQFSSGLIVPKAPGFEIRPPEAVGLDTFPGRQDDAVCLDASGRALYFERMIFR